jgi:hypothetical protein
MAGAYHVEVNQGASVVIGLPPPNQRGVVKFGAVFLSLAANRQAATVDLAIGRGIDLRFENNLLVVPGRRIVRKLQTGDEVALVTHRGGIGPVGVLVEYESRPDF